MINAKIVGDSLSPQGDRITSMLITFPRIILAELNTHRMLSKNTASSRAIPFEKMLKSVKENPFIPIAWQKDHKGMQGTEYCNERESEVLRDAWLVSRDEAVRNAKHLNALGTTKQLCNRLLEPFMWCTVLITGTEWENFSSLRCPQYYFNDAIGYKRSRRDMLAAIKEHYELLDLPPTTELPNINDDLWWLSINNGQAEIHMMALAEAIWDAYNESKPIQLKAGQWHIPFDNQIDLTSWEADMQSDIPMEQRDLARVQIATVMAARTSYTVVGSDQKPMSYERMLQLHDEMANAKPFHASPFEHCARVMTEEEYFNWVKGKGYSDYGGMFSSGQSFNDDSRSWCRNYRGFIQYREILENEKH